MSFTRKAIVWTWIRRWTLYNTELFHYNNKMYFFFTMNTDIACEGSTVLPIN